MQGLAEHKDELGAPLCPCRHYDDKVAEAQQGFWNCPCVPMRERKASPMLLSYLSHHAGVPLSMHSHLLPVENLIVWSIRGPCTTAVVVVSNTRRKRGTFPLPLR